MTRPGEGDHTLGLENLSIAVRYRQYLFDLISPHCGRSVLEIGSGTGDFAAHFPPGSLERLVVTDVASWCLDALRSRFGSRAEVNVMRFDASEGAPLDPPVQSAIAINVLEHLQDDAGALGVLRDSLEPGGTLAIFVPGYKQLFGEFDRVVGHVRRYHPRELERRVREAGFEVVTLRPVNLIGGIAWWLAVRIARHSRPRAGLVHFYDRLLVPVVRWMEKRWVPPFGQSVFCIARKPG
jgi:SAM-dependent methyltransferase